MKLFFLPTGKAFLKKPRASFVRGIFTELLLEKGDI